MTVKLGKKETIASIDVDAQNGFTPLCPEELPVPEGQQIVDALNQQAEFAAIRIGTKDAHPANAKWITTDFINQPIGSTIPAPGTQNYDAYWPAHCVPGTKGFELISGLPHPIEYDFFVWKGIEPDMHPYGACYHDLNNKISTGLIEYLNDKGITTVIVGGLATDYCLKFTVIQLLDAGFDVILNQSACRGLNKQTTNEALALMTAHGAIVIQSAQELTHAAF